MNLTTALRATIYVVSGAVMVLGVLVMVGVLVPRAIPGDYRIIMGAVVFLYGLYRFVVNYYRKPRE